MAGPDQQEAVGDNSQEAQQQHLVTVTFCAADMHMLNPGRPDVPTPSGADDSGLESGVDHDYDQDDDAHHVIEPHTDTDTASSDFDEGCVESTRSALLRAHNVQIC